MLLQTKKSPALRRRRGASKSGGSNPLRGHLLVLLLIAILLALGMLILVLVLQPPADQGKVRPGPLPGVPNLFRGRQIPAHNIDGGAAADQQQQLDTVTGTTKNQQQQPAANAASSHALDNTNPGTDLNAANGPPSLPKPVNTELYETRDTPPTQLYPYPLVVVDPNRDIGSTFSPPGGKRFTEYTTGGTPYLVTDEIRQASDAVARSRRHHVKAAMQHAWNGYHQFAFGSDEVLPQSGRGNDNWGGQGITLVDSLDTLWLMGMKDEFWQARDWVRDHLTHTNVGSVSVFETTIRDLGGLLAAYDWSGDQTFLDHALDLGKRLIKSFDGSSTGIPFGMVDLSNGRTSNIGWAGGNAILAEFGTLQLENRYLSKLTGQTEFATKTEHVYEILDKISREDGLYPYFIRNNPRRNGQRGEMLPEFANKKYSFGAMADSLYEYMLKIWLQGGKVEPLYRKMYDKAMDGMHRELLKKSSPSGLTFIADRNDGVYNHKMDHLVCFMGGLLALGAYTDPDGMSSIRAQRDLRTAKALTYTCYQMYARMNTGISAEFVQFEHGNDFVIGRGAPHYLLRPEAVESFFILNHLTGDPVYREWGWEVFQSIEKYCKTKIAYGELSNVGDTNGRPRDKMESFFLAETLKYLYLLQDPDTEIDLLRKHVFNTEAHPMRIFPVIDMEGTAAKAE